jgi:hypothetical protein
VGEPVAEVFGALAQAAVASADKQHLGRRKGVVSRLRITIITQFARAVTSPSLRSGERLKLTLIIPGVKLQDVSLTSLTAL